MAEVRNVMQELGAFLGGKFAKIVNEFAQIGNASAEYNSLGKIEAIIKALDIVVKGTEGSEDFDTLTKISTFLKTNKTAIASIGSKMNKSDIINALTASDTTINQSKALAAPQGKILKDTIDTLTLNVNQKADASAVYTKTEIGTNAEFTTAFNTTAGSLFNS